MSGSLAFFVEQGMTRGFPWMVAVRAVRRKSTSLARGKFLGASELRMFTAEGQECGCGNATDGFKNCSVERRHTSSNFISWPRSWSGRSGGRAPAGAESKVGD